MAKRPIQCMIMLMAGMLAWNTQAQAGTGADVLRQPILARAIALGGAYVGQAGDVTSVLYNPAGLAGIKNTQVAFTHQIGLVDSVEYASFGKTMKAGGVIAGSLLVRHMPAIDNAGAQDEAVNAGDLVAIVSYGRGFKTEEKGAEDVAAGINVKWLKSTLGNFEATTLAVDLGGWWQPSGLKELQVGLAVQNLGMAIKYETEEDSLPLGVLAGVLVKPYEDKMNAVKVLVDANVPMDTKLLKVNAGLEYEFNQMIAVRGGYQYQADALVSGLQAGIGVKVPLGNAQLSLDYAYTPVAFASDDTVSMHSIALMMGF